MSNMETNGDELRKYADRTMKRFISSIGDKRCIINLMIAINKVMENFSKFHGVTEVVNIVSEEQNRMYKSGSPLYTEYAGSFVTIGEKSIIYTVIHQETRTSSFIKYSVNPWFGIDYGWVDGVLYVNKENILYSIVKKMSDMRPFIGVFDNVIKDIEKNTGIVIASIDIGVVGGGSIYIGEGYEVSEDRAIYVAVYDENASIILNVYIGYIKRGEKIFGVYIKSYDEEGNEPFSMFGAINDGKIVTHIELNYTDKCEKYLKLTEKILSLISNNILCYKLLEPYTILLHVVI